MQLGKNCLRKLVEALAWSGITGPLAKPFLLLALSLILVLPLQGTAKSSETCLASVYGTKDKDQNGSTTASGIPLRDGVSSVAHKTYALRGWIRITNRKTGKVIVSQVIDRGPYVVGRCVDLSHEAAKELGVPKQSLTRVTVEGVK